MRSRYPRLKGSSISEEDAKLAEEQLPAQKVEVQNEPRALSFAELQELITQGKTDQIPNNKHIPDVLNDTPPSESVAAPRKKPWEM
ncbi:hypothetical protein K488DRAFT_81539 [Vararia minispora EC-137]|uniref:Uncharacterized protein n=1 Tax=Vararia minispora EC-137 TaxID=1314806 RepID=A0ACB8QYR2_9AGAM|nr:hypothetical protein K488DRAFT_81539 [Vararia minispora EC-137]